MEEKNSFKKIITGLIVVCLIGVGIWGVIQLDLQPAGTQVEKKPEITQEIFEEMPVGVIYEYSQEEIDEFIEQAKMKAEQYNDKKNYDYDEGETWFSGRPDIIGRYDNKNPMDTLNEDGSLKNPGAFIGYEYTNREHEVAENEYRLDTPDEYDATYHKMINARINTEMGWIQYNSNGEYVNRIFNKTLEEALYTNPEPYIEDYYGTLYGSPWIANLRRNGFIDFNKKGMNNAFGFMFYGKVDSYQLYRDFGDLKVVNPLGPINPFLPGYNIAKEIPDENVSIYYPTKVWKMADNLIVVDVRLDNGMMISRGGGHEDIFHKLKLANTTENWKEVVMNEHTNPEKVEGVETHVELHKGDYGVAVRLFNEDITNGLYPEFGTGFVNEVSSYCAPFHNGLGYDFVLNEQALNLLRDYFREVQRCLDNDELVSTSKIMEKLSKEHGIPYEDAISIWGVYTEQYLYV